MTRSCLGATHALVPPADDLNAELPARSAKGVIVFDGWTTELPPMFRTLESSDPALALLLHGVYGSHWAWAVQGGAHLTLQRLIDHGAIAPMVLAMPSGGLWGEGAGDVAHAGQDFERWIVDEVPAAARAAGIAHAYAEHEGGHDWAYWAQHLEETPRFFGQAFQTRASSP